MKQPSIRILIAEDQTLMRAGLKTLLELEPGFEIVGEARNGNEAVELAGKLRPDIVLMDVQMPHCNGVEATKKIVQRDARSRVIILTTFDRDDYVFQGVRAGASGYLLKDAPADRLIETIRRVHGGDLFIQPEIASRALKANLRTGEAMERLSERETEVLKLLADGIANKEIASRLSLSEGTVKNHVSNILSKLQAGNRTQAANIARNKGLI